MKCGLCNQESQYRLHEGMQPHCEEHFHEAIDRCMKPTIVMSEESFQEMIRDAAQRKAG